jgi:hypothetical protein
MNSNPLHFWVLGQKDVFSKGLEHRLLYNLGGPNFQGSIRRWETGYMASYRPDVLGQTYRHLVKDSLEVGPPQDRIGGKGRNR